MEWFLFLVAAFAGLIPLCGKSKCFPRRGFGVAFVLAGFVFVIVGGWTVKTDLRSQALVRTTNAIPREGESIGYVSSDKCQACHPDQFASWHQSFHRTMTQFPSAATVKAPFDRTLELDGEKFIFEQHGDNFWVDMIDPDWKHDKAKAEQDYSTGVSKVRPSTEPNPPRTKCRISMLTGSHNFQAYWVTSKKYGNVQFAFPFAWIIEEKRWAPRKDTFIRDPTQSSPIQIWNANCIQCHSTCGLPRLDRRTGGYSTRVGEIGISCEACHGPAEQHVRNNLDPIRRYGLHQKNRNDTTIVNPSRLDPKVSTQVCGQCHSIKWNLYRDDWLQNGFRYRPGEELEKMTPIVRPKKFDSEVRFPESMKRDRAFLDMIFWPDGIIRVTGREYNGLIESSCYQRGGIACISCHSMHRSNPDDQLAQGMSGNQACVQCHDSIQKRLEQHTHHMANSSGSQCYNCHMPHDTYGLLKAVRSHYIASPDVETSLQVGRPNACNLCHLDKTLDWTAKRLTTWYGRPELHLGDTERSVSAALLWLLRGDAAQRALIAWNMGWKPAREISGQTWLVPHLAGLLSDPYSAVRYIAYRSLRQSSGYSVFQYDYAGVNSDLERTRRDVLDLWSKTDKNRLDRSGSEVLIDAIGNLDEAKIDQLLKNRDNRAVELIE